jgi:hypothetical protein
MKATILYKLNQIARLRLFSGMKDDSVATLVGLSRGGLSRIIALPEYAEVERQLLDGGITKLDEAVAQKHEEMKKLFAPAVPAAMRTLVEVVTQRRDLRAAVAASIEVLDRDPDRNFTKASRHDSENTRANAVPAGVMAAAMTATAGVVAASQPAASQKAVVVQPPDKTVN